MHEGFEIAEDGMSVSGTTRQGRRARVALRRTDGVTSFEVSVFPLPGIPDGDERAADVEALRVAAEHDAIARRLAERFGDDLSPWPEENLIDGAALAIVGRTPIPPVAGHVPSGHETPAFGATR